MFVAEASTLGAIHAACEPLGPDGRAEYLENSKPLAEAYEEAARQGDSAVPENPEDYVEYHYVCFVKSLKNGHLYELDGDKKGPIDLGPFEDDDLLSDAGLKAVKAYVNREDGLNIGFGLMALGPAME